MFLEKLKKWQWRQFISQDVWNDIGDIVSPELLQREKQTQAPSRKPVIAPSVEQSTATFIQETMSPPCMPVEACSNAKQTDANFATVAVPSGDEVNVTEKRGKIFS